MQAELKNENGLIYARQLDCDPWLAIPEKKRNAHGRLIRIQQWINPLEAKIWWLLDRIRTSMIYNPELVNEDELSFYDRDAESETVIVEWDAPVLLHMPDFIHKSSLIYLMNGEGRILSGSNIYDSGFSTHRGLCLGQAFDPLGVQPVELLVQNEANTDLRWQGDPILGEWAEEEIDNLPSAFFIIQTWPCLPQFQLPPPPLIKDAFERWSRS